MRNSRIRNTDATTCLDNTLRRTSEVVRCNREVTEFAALYRDYVAELSDGIRGRFGDGPPDPEDIAQEAFQKLLERGDVSKIKNLRAYLWRTARNLVLTSKRSASQRSNYDFEVEHIFFPLRDDISSPEVITVAREQLRAINDLLRAMPEKRRWALLLYRLEGLTLNEIAARFGISRTAVSKHISKAESQIHALFLDESEG